MFPQRSWGQRSPYTGQEVDKREGSPSHCSPTSYSTYSSYLFRYEKHSKRGSICQRKVSDLLKDKQLVITITVTVHICIRSNRPSHQDSDRILYSPPHLCQGQERSSSTLTVLMVIIIHVTHKREHYSFPIFQSIIITSHHFSIASNHHHLGMFIIFYLVTFCLSLIKGGQFENKQLNFYRKRSISIS